MKNNIVLRGGKYAAVLVAGLLLLGCASNRFKNNDPTTESQRVPRGAAVRITCKYVSANEVKVQFFNASTKELLGEAGRGTTQLIIPPAANKVAYKLDLVALVRDPEQPKDKAPWLPAYIKLASSQGNKNIYAVDDGYENSNLQAPVYAQDPKHMLNYGDMLLTVELVRPDSVEPTTQRTDLP